MGAMAALLALSALVPDLDSLSPSRLAELRRTRPLLLWIGRHLRPGEIVGSPPFLLLPLVLSLGIVRSLVERVRAHLTRGTGPSAAAARFRVERVLRLDAPLTPGTLERHLVRDGYEVTSTGPDHVEAGKGRRGFWGSIAFHVGLILILAGIATSSRTRFSGEFLLAEGFRAPFAVSSMFNVSGAGRFRAREPAEIAIRDFTADYSPEGTASDYGLILSVASTGAVRKEQQVRVNQAFWWDGYQITLHRYGFAPGLSVSGPGVSLDGVVVLQLLPPGREDAVVLGDGGRLLVRLFPDYATLKGEPASRSLDPQRPVLVFRCVDAQGRERAAGSIERGSVSTVNGYTVAFPSLRYWGGFIVARDLGLWLFVAGSILGSLGLALRIVFPDQILHASLRPEGEGMEVRLRSGTRFFPALHEEQVDRLISRLRMGGA